MSWHAPGNVPDGRDPRMASAVCSPPEASRSGFASAFVAVAMMAEAQPIRFATASASGTPDVVPVPVTFRDDGDDIASGGFDTINTVCCGVIEANLRATVVVDHLASLDPWSPRGLKIVGSVTAMEGDTRQLRNSTEKIII